MTCHSYIINEYIINFCFITITPHFSPLYRDASYTDSTRSYNIHNYINKSSSIEKRQLRGEKCKTTTMHNYKYSYA